MSTKRQRYDLTSRATQRLTARDKKYIVERRVETLQKIGATRLAQEINDVFGYDTSSTKTCITEQQIRDFWSGHEYKQAYMKLLHKEKGHTKYPDITETVHQSKSLMEKSGEILTAFFERAEEVDPLVLVKVINTVAKVHADNTRIQLELYKHVDTMNAKQTVDAPGNTTNKVAEDYYKRLMSDDDEDPRGFKR